jgi:biopolymer transport protein ExbD
MAVASGILPLATLAHPCAAEVPEKQGHFPVKMSRRAKRMQRNHSRTKGQGGLNLIALVDIFTIMVFFLVVSSSEVEVLPNTKIVKLPESITEKAPRKNVLVMVSDKDIMVQGMKVASVQEVMDAKTDVITALKTRLDEEGRASSQEGKVDGDITIMGDKAIPYRLLRKIMVTCTRANYTNISLAVVQKPRDPVPSAPAGQKQ